MRLHQLTGLALLAVSGAASAQLAFDARSSGPVNVMGNNPVVPMYVSNAFSRNLTNVAKLQAALDGTNYPSASNPVPAGALYQLSDSTVAPANKVYFDDVYTLNAGVTSNLSFDYPPTNPPAGARRKFFKFTLKNTDPLNASASRTEAALKYDYQIDGPRSYAMSFYFPGVLPNGSVPSTGVWNPPNEDNAPVVVAQIQTSQKTFTGSPPVAVVVTYSPATKTSYIDLDLSYNHRTTSGTVDPATKENSGVQNIRLGKMETNKWYCMVFIANWSHVPGVGSFTAYMNGDIVYQSSNIHNAYETWLGNFPKVGIYQPGKMSVSGRTMFADFIYAGSSSTSPAINPTYEGLSKMTPCGTNPLAVNATTGQTH